jgi:AcrR family transcriptional regulator/DNA-binding XRE family transcriptional regulator
MSALGERVKVLRQARGLTQGDLARSAGVSNGYISKVERGAITPPEGTLSRLVASLAPTPEAFWGEQAAPVSTGRGEILAAAIALFADKGYSRVSIRELAQRAGCSTANLYHHFASKYDIFVSLIEGAMERHNAGLEEAVELYDSPAAQLRHVLRAHLVVHMTRPEVRLLREDFHPIVGPELQRFIRGRDRYERGVRRIVERGLREGELEVADAAVAVRAAMAACTAVDRWFRPDGPLSAERIADLTADFLLAGFGAPGATAAAPRGTAAGPHRG